MAYIGNTARLFQDIVDGELERVQDWLCQDGADPNTRDHTGRTPLHLAVTSSTVDIVKCLVDHGARLVARLADGRTALHLAAERGDTEIVKILMDKSTANEAEEEEKQAQNQKAKTASIPQEGGSTEESESDVELVSDADSDNDGEQHSMATGSFVKIKKDESSAPAGAVPEDKEDDPDYYDINVVAWDSPCSAVHFAIICGHEDVVKLLCQEYGADILLPVKVLNEEKLPTAAILTLVLSIKLPIEKAKSMAKTILSLGASSAQADMKGTTAFQRIVEENAAELVEVLLAFDEVGAKNSINHLSFSNRQQIDSALQRAIEGGDVRLVLQLLDAGAVPQIDFEMWLKAAKQSPNMEYDLRGLEHNEEIFERGTEQPIITAIQSSNPSIVLELLKRGVDVNAMTTESYQVLHNTGYGYSIGETVLDLVEDQLERLRKYEPPSAEYPELKFGMEDILSKYEQGTWKYAAVRTAALDAKKRNDAKLEDYEKEKARIAELEGVQEKQAAVDAAISKFEEIKQLLVSSGGKTFSDLHPHRNDSRRPSHYQWQPPKEPLEFSYNFRFLGVSDVTDKRAEKYVELFEAAWSGDSDKIKGLTLASWGPENNEPPLQIAVNDGSNSPFSLAYMRGHLDVAKMILEIAQAQYVPKEKPVTRYRMQSSDEEDYEDEDESASDDNEPRIYGEVVDDQFTIDNVGQVSMQVKSRTKPLAMLGWAFPALRSDDGKHSFSGGCSLLEHVISDDDRKGLKYYHDLTVYFSDRDECKEDENDQLVAFPQSAFWSAVDKGRIEILADMIKWAGAGLPLEALVKKTGVELRENPRYYQGLTVYGKKRKDWANAGRNVVSRPKDSTESPLLRTAQKGCLESVEWFLSDAPLRNYLDFGKTKRAKDDLRFNHLSQSSGGFETAVKKWLGAENDLVISAAVLGPNDGHAHRLVEYLIKAYPSSIEAKGASGITALYMASWLGRVDLVKLLIAHGADQSTKSPSYDSIIHAALANDPDPEKLEVFLKAVDADLLAHLVLERSGLKVSDGRTPLHRWLATHAKSISGKPERYIKILHLLLQYSNGKELDTLDARGDTPLHTLIREQANLAMIREILTFNPQLLHRENAVGQTPAEVAHDTFVRACVPHRYDRWGYNHYHRHGDKTVAQVLLNRSPEEFARLAKHGGEPPTETPRVQQIYDLVAEFAAAHPGKRRLVTLHEANDVAQRIGETYQGQRYGWMGFKGRQRRRARRRARANNLPDEEVAGEEEQTIDVLSGRLFTLRLSAWEEVKKDGLVVD
jgi:ankyrin repeat protein